MENGFNRDPLKLAKNVILHKVNKPLHLEITLMTMQFIWASFKNTFVKVSWKATTYWKVN